MLRFLSLLALLPFFVAWQTQTQASSDFVYRRAPSQAHPAVADIQMLQRNKLKVERRYGDYDEQMQQRHSELARRWVLFDDKLAKDVGFMNAEDNVFVQGLTEAKGKIESIFGNSKATVPAKTKQQQSHKAAAAGAAAPAAAPAGSGNKKVTAIPLTTETNPNGQEREVLADITLGAQKFRIDPDTGSSDLWIVSDLCKSGCGSTRDKYNTKSSTAQSANKQFSIQYGQGSTSGQLYRDTAKLGDLTVQNLTIGAARHISSDLASDPAAGILGLGFRSITSAGQKTFLDRLFEQESLAQKVVAFAFGRSSKNTLGKAEMRFGDVNTALFKGSISYTAVSKEGYWQFPIASFGAAAGDANAISTDSIVDTGTSLIAVQQADADKFYKSIKDSKLNSDQGYYTYPCDAKIGAVLKTKDGQSFTMDDADFNLGSESVGSKRCVGAVFPAQTRGVSVLGIAFLKNAYSVLDYQQKRVGLAQYSY
ncbi:unnamed protein product [Parajaminaea phylloscopi]